MSQDTTLDAVLHRLDQGLDAALDRLTAFLRIPSISTDPAHAGDVRAAAEWLRDELAGIGFDASVRDTPGHPMVVARSQAGYPATTHERPDRVAHRRRWTATVGW